MAAAKKSGSKKDAPALVDEAQKRRERITLALFFIGGTAIVLGMVILSKFLSQQDPIAAIKDDKVSLYGFAIFGLLTAAGVGYQMATKPR